MSIKKRPPVDPAAREAAIEAFGLAANSGPTTEPETPAPAKAPQSTGGSARRASPARAKAKTTGEKTEIKPMLMRFDAEQHALLQEVAGREGRSMHNMALTALIPALEAIRDAHRR